MTCDNCANSAVWVFDDRGAGVQHFCKTCLPWFLTERARNGSLKKVEAPAPAKVEAAPQTDHAPADTPEQTADEAPAVAEPVKKAPAKK
jgi:predicted ATPase